MASCGRWTVMQLAILHALSRGLAVTGPGGVVATGGARGGGWSFLPFNTCNGFGDVRAFDGQLCE